MIIRIPIKEIKIETQKVEGYSHRDLEIILKKRGINYETISQPHVDKYYFRKSTIQIHGERNIINILNNEAKPRFSKVYHGGEVRYYYLAKHKVIKIGDNMDFEEFINSLKKNKMKYYYSFLGNKDLCFHERTILRLK